MSITKAQWAAMEKLLSHPYGRVELRVPGHDLMIEVRCVKPLRYAPVVFVDGAARGEYLAVEHPIGKRFYPLRTKSLLPKAKAEASFKKLKRIVGTAKAEAISGVKKTYSYRDLCWRSPKALCAHLRRNEPEIELVSDLGELTP